MRIQVILATALAGLLAGAAHAGPQSKAKSKSKDSEVRKSTEAAPASISSVYRVEKRRDPFIKSTGSGPVRKTSDAGEEEEFSIHRLALRAVMKDRQTGYALFSDKETGASYVFRKGRLYDSRNKRVPGVMGVLNIRRKSVKLFTRDKDSEQFRLGQDEEESR